jgi:hypothetical protein
VSSTIGAPQSNDAFGIVGAGDDLTTQILATTQAVLLAANTLAFTQVEISRSESFTADDVVAISLYVPIIGREWLGDSPCQFKTTVQMVIVGVVYEALAADMKAKSNQLRVQIENAVFRSGAFWQLPIERIRAVDTSIDYPADASPHQGIVRMVLHCECTEIFNEAITPLSGPSPIGAIGAPFTEADLTVQGSAGETLIAADIIIPSQGA